jgi:hypothetical protein
MIFFNSLRIVFENHGLVNKKEYGLDYNHNNQDVGINSISKNADDSNKGNYQYTG